MNRSLSIWLNQFICKVHDDSIAIIHRLLCQEASSGKHSKITVLQLLCDHHIQVIKITSRLKAEGVKSNNVCCVVASTYYKKVTLVIVA